MKIKRYFTLRLVLFHDTGVAYLSVNVSTVHKYLSGRTFTHVSMWICFFSSFLRWGQGYGNTLLYVLLIRQLRKVLSLLTLETMMNNNYVLGICKTNIK